MECSSSRSYSNDGSISSQQSQQYQYKNKVEETKPLIILSNGMTQELYESYRNLRIYSILLFATSLFSIILW